MKVYQYNHEGYFICETTAYNNLMPHNCTDVAPPIVKEKHRIKWNGTKWIQESIPVPDAKEGCEVVWNIEKKEYEQILLPPTIDELFEEAIYALKNERDDIESSPVLYKDLYFDFDQTARERMFFAIEKMQKEETLSQTWVTATNTLTQVSADDLKEIRYLGALRSASLHEQYNIAKYKLSLAKTEIEIENIRKETFI